MGILRTLFPVPIEFDLAVDATPAEVRRVLSESVSPRTVLSRLWVFSGPTFIGSVGRTDFRIRMRTVRYDSLRPWIHGAIEPSESGGSIVLADARLPAFASMFMSIWLLLVALFALLGVCAVTDGAPLVFLVLPLLLGAGGFLFMRWVCRTIFPDGADAVKGFLLEILEPLGGHEISGPPPPSPRSA